MIEYLWNAACREPRSRTIDLKKTEHSDSLNIQFSIINSQFRLVRSVPELGNSFPRLVNIKISVVVCGDEIVAARFVVCFKMVDQSILYYI